MHQFYEADMLVRNDPNILSATKMKTKDKGQDRWVYDYNEKRASKPTCCCWSQAKLCQTGNSISPENNQP